MANLEVLALDTAVPQIRAPGAGDGYSVPRDMTMASGTTLAAQAVTSTSLGTTGNLTFSSTGQRITGDMSNATIGNRLAFQTSTTNGNTDLNIIPNGTSVTSGIRLNNNSDTTDAGYVRMSLNSTGANIAVDRNSVSGTYLPLGFNTGGSERMRLDTSGNLGIGTTSPGSFYSEARNLVVGTGTGGQGMTIYAGTASQSRLMFADGTTGSDPYTGFVQYDHSSNALAFGTNGGTERMRIDSSGNVGIGTASPSFKFEVQQGSSGATPSLRQTPQIVLKGYGGSSSYHSGIGFSMFEHTNGYWGSGILEVDDSGSYGAAMAFYTSTGSATPTPSERMRIDSSGNVGIGGTAEAYTKIGLYGTLPTNSAISIGFRNAATVPSGSTGGAYGYNNNLITQAASFTLSDYYHFFAYQNIIGAGSTVTNQYGYFADATLTGATNNFGFYSNIASGSNRWNFYAAGTADNYFAGNVGIGTASPATKFQVYGDTNAAVQARVTNINAGASAASLFTFGNNTDAYVGYVGCVSSAGVAANGVYFGSRIASPVVISTDNTERMRITSGGEVYIAGTTDQGAYNLQCNGTGVWGAGAYVNGSDARLKDNIQSLDSGLDVVKAMRPVTFQYKPDYSKDQSVQPGFIAQELQTAMAGKPYLEGVVQEGPNHLNVAYQNIIPILVKAIQELSVKVAALEAK